MRTNLITSGSFQGEETYIHGKTITIGLFKKAKKFLIDDFEIVTSEYKAGSAVPIALGMAFGGTVGGLLGAALSGKSEVYTKVKIKYGTRFKSTVLLGDKQYKELASNNINAKSPVTITFKLD